MREVVRELRLILCILVALTVIVVCIWSYSTVTSEETPSREENPSRLTLHTAPSFRRECSGGNCDGSLR